MADLDHSSDGSSLDSRGTHLKDLMALLLFSICMSPSGFLNLSGFMCFYGYFLSKMWFCLLGLSVFLLGALLHKFPHHSSLNSRGTRLELVALLLVTFVFYGYFWAGNPYEILLLLLLSPQDTNQFFSLSLVVVAAEGSSQDSKLEFSEDEETLITRMFNLVGERWSLIAGRIPGRTAEEIEKYWTSRYSSSE
ncbi:Transcription factor CPC [Vitis vinifera]|uniref:Transcription factor CPC n=1 Tax=Vitis vinifera TaxID=29760 RepID=A0A438G2M0_VITVI|nr:Transcription factor CPC [Vitis vinifera]